MLEERRARPGWGANVTLGFLKALEGGKLLPVSQLNDGFVRPTWVPVTFYSVKGGGYGRFNDPKVASMTKEFLATHLKPNSPAQ